MNSAETALNPAETALVVKIMQASWMAVPGESLQANGNNLPMTKQLWLQTVLDGEVASGNNSLSYMC